MTPYISKIKFANNIRIQYFNHIKKLIHEKDTMSISNTNQLLCKLILKMFLNISLLRNIKLNILLTINRFKKECLIMLIKHTLRIKNIKNVIFFEFLEKLNWYLYKKLEELRNTKLLLKRTISKHSSSSLLGS